RLAWSGSTLRIFLSNSSVFGFSTFGADGPSPPPPPPRAGRGGAGFRIWSGISLVRCFQHTVTRSDDLRKFQLRQIFHCLRVDDDFEALPDESWVEQIAQIKFDLLLGP